MIFTPGSRCCRKIIPILAILGLTGLIFLYGITALNTTTNIQSHSLDLKEPLKYFRCPGFHPSFKMDGLNILKRKILGFLGEIQCVDKDRVILMPPLLNHGNMLDRTDGVQYLIPFDSVFDLEKLNEFTFPIRLEADVVDSKNWSYNGFVEKDEVKHEFREQSLGFFACKRIIKPLPQALTCTKGMESLRDGKAMKSLISVVGRERALDAFLALRPAPKLREIAEKFLAASFSQGTDSLLCIHLRTEHDFKKLFKNPPRYYSEEQYFQKVKWQMSKYPELYKNISNVFIAGDHSEEYMNNTVRTLFKKLFNGNVFGHESIKPFGYDSLENIQRSAIDLHICAQSYMFIGNSLSGFSEMTHFLRKAMHRNIDLENNRDFMINHPRDTSELVYDEMDTNLSTIRHAYFD